MNIHAILRITLFAVPSGSLIDADYHVKGSVIEANFRATTITMSRNEKTLQFHLRVVINFFFFDSFQSLSQRVK